MNITIHHVAVRLCFCVLMNVGVIIETEGPCVAGLLSPCIATPRFVRRKVKNAFSGFVLLQWHAGASGTGSAARTPSVKRIKGFNCGFHVAKTSFTSLHDSITTAIKGYFLLALRVM